jgi:hypothetical protein
MGAKQAVGVTERPLAGDRIRALRFDIFRFRCAASERRSHRATPAIFPARSANSRRRQFLSQAPDFGYPLPWLGEAPRQPGAPDGARICKEGRWSSFAS